MDHPHTRNPDGSGGTVEDNNDGNFIEAAYAALDQASRHLEELRAVVRQDETPGSPLSEAQTFDGAVEHVGGIVLNLGRAIVYAVIDAGYSAADR